MFEKVFEQRLRFGISKAFYFWLSKWIRTLNSIENSVLDACYHFFYFSEKSLRFPSTFKNSEFVKKAVLFYLKNAFEADISSKIFWYSENLIDYMITCVIIESIAFFRIYKICQLNFKSEKKDCWYNKCLIISVFSSDIMFLGILVFDGLNICKLDSEHNRTPSL